MYSEFPITENETQIKYHFNEIERIPHENKLEDLKDFYKKELENVSKDIKKVMQEQTKTNIKLDKIETIVIRLDERKEEIDFIVNNMPFGHGNKKMVTFHTKNRSEKIAIKDFSHLCENGKEHKEKISSVINRKIQTKLKKYYGVESLVDLPTLHKSEITQMIQHYQLTHDEYESVKKSYDIWLLKSPK